jgi:hypothetical protein
MECSGSFGLLTVRLFHAKISGWSGQIPASNVLKVGNVWEKIVICSDYVRSLVGHNRSGYYSGGGMFVPAARIHKQVANPGATVEEGVGYDYVYKILRAGG